jgi:hypothetical protein
MPDMFPGISFSQAVASPYRRVPGECVEIPRRISANIPQFREQQLLIRVLEVQAHLPRKGQICEADGLEHRNGFARLACQICFKAFGTDEALRRHIVHYQFEQRRLIKKLRNVQVHAPRKDYCGSPKERALGAGGTTDVYQIDTTEDASFRDDYSDGADDYGLDCDDRYMDGTDRRDRPNNKDETHSASDRTSIHCPRRICQEEQRKFTTRKQLLRHAESHAFCLQICGFCREISTRVSAALRHECDERKRAKRNERDLRHDWKESYRLDRREQLPRESEAILNKMLSRDSITRSKKRGSDSIHGRQVYSAPKRFKGGDSNGMAVAKLPPEDTQSFQAELPQTDRMLWESANIEILQNFEEHTQILKDDVIPSLHPVNSQSDTAIDIALPEYPPIFEDGTIPPLYPVTSQSDMAFARALREYPPIFEDGTIPPLHSVTSHSDVNF